MVRVAPARQVRRRLASAFTALRRDKLARQLGATSQWVGSDGGRWRRLGHCSLHSAISNRLPQAKARFLDLI